MARSRGSLRPWKHGRRRPVLTTHAPALRTAVRHMPEMSEAGLLQHAWPLRVPSGSRWHALRPRRPPAHLRRSESAQASQRRSEGSMRAAVHLTCVCVIHHGNQQSCRPAVLRCHRRHRHECSPRVLEPRHELGSAIRRPGHRHRSPSPCAHTSDASASLAWQVCLSCSSESRNSKHLFAIVLHIYFRARKAAVSTSRRAAGEEGVSKGTTYMHMQSTTNTEHNHNCTMRELQV